MKEACVGSPSTVCDLLKKRRPMEALAEAWKISELFRYPYLTQSLQESGLDLGLSELIFFACRDAVNKAKGGALREVEQWMEGLLTSPPPNILVNHDDGPHADWCQAYRSRMIRAHLLCTRVACRAIQLASVDGQAWGGTGLTLERASEALLAPAWEAITLLKAPQSLERLSSPPQYWEELTKELLRNAHWPSGGLTATGLAENAFSVLAQAVSCQPAFPAALMRHLTRELIEGPHGKKEAELRVPVALVQESSAGQAEAVLAQFVLECLADGKGEVFIAPEQAFVPMDEEFRRLFLDVPFAVARCLEDQGVHFSRLDIRLRVELEPRAKFTSPLLRGNSASGAVARGMYFALTGRVPDPGVMVMAQLKRDGSVAGVDGIEEKVRAAAAVESIDTIIVASKEDQGKAVPALLVKDREIEKVQVHGQQEAAQQAYVRFERGRLIKVVSLDGGDLKQLVRVRSQQSQELLIYLESLEEELSKNPLLERFGRRLDQLRVPLRVLPHEPVRDLEELRLREHFRLGGGDTNRVAESTARRAYFFRGARHGGDAHGQAAYVDMRERASVRSLIASGGG